MNYDIKDNTGKAFINNFRTKESHPNYKGKLKVDGVVKDVSIWKKLDKNGNAFLSISVQPEWEATNKKDEDIPFGE